MHEPREHSRSSRYMDHGYIQDYRGWEPVIIGLRIRSESFLLVTGRSIVEQYPGTLYPTRKYGLLEPDFQGLTGRLNAQYWDSW
jgi:hypothetical protein